MFGSSMIDIAIGVVFVFLLLSVFATAINEIILSAMNMRGKELLRGIGALLNDKTGGGLVEKVYTHGQIYGLFTDQYDPRKPGNLPSYIPSRNFALALLDSVAQPFSESVKRPAAQAAPPGPPAAPQQQPAAVAIVQEAAVITQAFKDAAKLLAADCRTEKVGKPLVSMIAMAGDDAAKLQKSVEDWYNSGMDRVSGWYKYRTQWVLFGIGVVMALALNVDTINIVRQLSKDSTLRQSIVAAAQSVKDPSAGAATSGESTEQRMAAAKKSFEKIDNLGIPLGWSDGVPSAEKIPEKIGGLLLTAIAISLGAPFWFDALNKIMVIRSTVKPREKSHDEGSKDKSRT